MHRHKIILLYNQKAPSFIPPSFPTPFQIQIGRCVVFPRAILSVSGERLAPPPPPPSCDACRAPAQSPLLHLSRESRRRTARPRDAIEVSRIAGNISRNMTSMRTLLKSGLQVEEGNTTNIITHSRKRRGNSRESRHANFFWMCLRSAFVQGSLRNGRH